MASQRKQRALLSEGTPLLRCVAWTASFGIGHMDFMSSNTSVLGGNKCSEASRGLLKLLTLTRPEWNVVRLLSKQRILCYSRMLINLIMILREEGVRQESKIDHCSAHFTTLQEEGLWERA